VNGRFVVIIVALIPDLREIIFFEASLKTLQSLRRLCLPDLDEQMWDRREEDRITFHTLLYFCPCGGPCYRESEEFYLSPVELAFRSWLMTDAEEHLLRLRSLLQTLLANILADTGVADVHSP